MPENNSDVMGTFTEFSQYFRESFSGVLQLRPTVHRDRLSHVLHEPAIIKGYRQTNQPWRYYLMSLFQIHNETGNVWSHLVGFVGTWVVMAEYSNVFDFWTDKHAWPILIFGITCLTSNLMSSSAHLLHSKSSYHHYTLFMLDYIGVTVYAFGTGIQTFYGCSDRRTYAYFGNIYLVLLWFDSWVSYVVLCLAKITFGASPHDMRRKYIQVGIMSLQAFIVMMPFVPRYYHCYYDNTCSLTSLNHLTTNFILFVTCAFFFGSHMPEKLFPGKCDILGHGHQIFHIILFTNQLFQFHAMCVDYDSGAAAHTKPDIVRMIVSVMFLILAEVLSFMYLKRFVKVDEDEKSS